MTSMIGMAKQSDEKRKEFENEAIRIIRAAAAQGLTLRLLGSLSFQFQCPTYAHLQKDLGRSYTDIDYAGYSMQASKMKPLFESLRYAEDAEVNIYYAGQRMIFYQPKKNGIHVYLEKAKERLACWVRLAEERLAGTNVCCYLTGGNDDSQEILQALYQEASEHVIPCEDIVVNIGDEGHTMVSLAHSNPGEYPPRNR